MYKILKAEMLAENIYLMDVEAKRVAKSCLPGQFVIVKIDEKGERIPLTICDYDRDAGTVTIVLQTVGAQSSEDGVAHIIGAVEELIVQSLRRSKIIGRTALFLYFQPQRFRIQRKESKICVMNKIIYAVLNQDLIDVLQ